MGGKADDQALYERHVGNQGQMLGCWTCGLSFNLRATQEIGVLEDVIDDKVLNQVRVPIEQRARVEAISIREVVGDLMVGSRNRVGGVASKAALEGANHRKEGLGDVWFRKSGPQNLSGETQLESWIGFKVGKFVQMVGRRVGVLSDQRGEVGRVVFSPTRYGDRADNRFQVVSQAS